MKIGSSDVKLLKVFLAVVDSNGISNAQSVLNKDASTISKALTQLEERLSLRLCERGRHGFSLTAEGREIYEEGVKLFISLRGLEKKIELLNGAGAGLLNVGIIDNIISDQHCPLRLALQTGDADGSRPPQVNLQVETPADLERRLLDKRLDIAISIFESKNDYIEYKPLYCETDFLFCSTRSPLGRRVLADEAEEAILAALRDEMFVSRKFLNQELGWLTLNSEDQVYHASNIEAVLFLILSGQRIGFVPEHFARSWVDKGEVVTVLPDRLSHRSVIEAAYLKSAAARPAIAHFLSRMGTAVP
ncbi:LysR family transcriptional regulator [Hyphomicrobium sp. CS1GBMeth3]|uniref:LysR family transcriptional regulator n=1 Tax=Hyphomicrobium sp. CS1GBMeth3 TaxID=1892845 RepID=UPI00093097D6|nr:LysR family transcriptional regulator [Hyphomicrobium sp. CS1GBMeth3]